MSRRIERVNNLIRQEISELLQRQVKDPRLGGFVTVTQVSTSPDLRHAKIFISIMGNDLDSYLFQVIFNNLQTVNEVGSPPYCSEDQGQPLSVGAQPEPLRILLVEPNLIEDLVGHLRIVLKILGRHVRMVVLLYLIVSLPSEFL